MAVITIHDRANEYRIEITGKFSGECVRDVESAWRRALQDRATRKHTVDISGLTGFDQLGRKVLREMHLHGMNFAAGTPSSLVFLSEISGPPRRGAASEVTPIRESGKTPEMSALHGLRAVAAK